MKYLSEIWIYLIGIFIIISIMFSYCEYIHYYIIISQCTWKSLQSVNIEDDLRVMVVADTHLLGKRNGHWFDKLRREWQMYRSFQTSIQLLSPNVVIFLGDLFDEGKWCSDAEFLSYLNRFEELFYLPKNMKLIIAAGNHDIGFHYSTNHHLVSRFDEAFQTPSVYMRNISGVQFITLNSVAMDGDDCFLCKPARLMINRLYKEFGCIKQADGLCNYSHNQPLVRPILLQHYPLYRKSDAHCNQSDEAPQEIKFKTFKEKWDCLSKESSKLLLKLQPRVVLSGHTHYGCKTSHDVTFRDISGDTLINSSVIEYNVASFSWRNTANPTFLMMTVSPSKNAISICHLPIENTIKLLYCNAILLVFLWTTYRYVGIKQPKKYKVV